MIPAFIAGFAVVGGLANISASADNSEAKSINLKAEDIIREANGIAIDAKSICQGSMNKLATEKTVILQGNMKRFVKSFSKIKPVNFTDSGDLFEAAKFDKKELMTMQSLVTSVQKVKLNDVASGVSGAALAVGAADVLAGGTILGGAGVELSFAGLAGGAALGAIAAPIFAVTGLFSASEAAENLEKAKGNMSRAKAFKDQCETYALFASAVSDRCNLYYVVLKNVNDTWFSDAVLKLETLVNSKKNIGNFIKNVAGKKIYSREEMAMIASVASLAKMVKTLIDTNILDQDGNVTPESKRIVLAIQDKLTNDPPIVKMPQATSMENSQQEQGYDQVSEFADRVQSGVDSIKNNERYLRVTNELKSSVEKVKNSDQYGQLQEGVQTSVETVKKQVKKIRYQPNVVTLIIMWLMTIIWVGMGIHKLFGGLFLTSMFWIAAGIVICPITNIEMKFLTRFIIMCVFVIVGIIL